jgi:hypothetical protein
MFGGYDGSKCFNDLDVLDFDTMTWLQVRRSAGCVQVSPGKRGLSLPLRGILRLCGIRRCFRVFLVELWVIIDVYLDCMCIPWIVVVALELSAVSGNCSR